ncbi:MAG TPA: 4Fe-4S dicluster domain-containing protein, partial [Syntrophomonadaceae bacterium]|nr:4Fe-4S dicluster domain-containing protein [Syntrophomonadaceae bacterium]
PYGAPKFASDAAGTRMSKCTMCIDRLEKGQKPICVASCPLRALDFGPLDEMIAQYGDQRRLEGMPDERTTKPAFLVKPHAPKKELIPYDADKALQLMQKRGELGTVFDSIDDVKEIEAGTVGRDELKMKHSNVKELMEATRNDIG